MILKPAEPPCRTRRCTGSGGERYFGLALRHEEVDDVISRFAALNQYAVLADRDDFLAGCAELMSAVRHLREMELPTVENIL